MEERPSSWSACLVTLLVKSVFIFDYLKMIPLRSPWKLSLFISQDISFYLPLIFSWLIEAIILQPPGFLYYSLEICHSNLLSLWESSAFISLSSVYRTLHGDLSCCGFLFIYLGLKFIQQLYLKYYKHCLGFPYGAANFTFHRLCVCVSLSVTSSLLMWGFPMPEISSNLSFSSLIFSLAVSNF